MKIKFSIFITLFTLISTISAITTAESGLKKVYTTLGLSREKASSLIKKTKKAFNKLANTNEDKESLKLKLIPIFETGLIIELCINGKKVVADVVQNIINNLPKKKVKKIDYLTLRNIMFEWLKDKLSQYDEMSFNLAYTFRKNPQAEKAIFGTQDTSSNLSNIFIYNIQLKDKDDQEENENEPGHLENLFELLSLESTSIDAKN